MEVFLVQHIHYRGALLYLLNSFNISLCSYNLYSHIKAIYPTHVPTVQHTKIPNSALFAGWCTAIR